MRLQSQDNLSFLEVERRDDDGYAIFNCTASIEGFSGKNDGIIFTGCAEFLRQLGAFDESRSGAITLEGTEQFRLSIAAFDNARHLRVDIRLCKYSYQPGPRTIILTLEGGFVFDVEFAHTIFRELRELLHDCG